MTSQGEQPFTSTPSKSDLFTLANLFSLSRVLVALPIIWVYELYGGVSWAFTLLVVYAILSDYLDGWAARSRNEISEFGKMIDPIADKLLAGVLFIHATWVGLIPLWFLILTISRDLLILTGSTWIKKRFGRVAMSIPSGKVFVNALALYWLSLMYFPPGHWSADYFMSGSLVLLICSFIDYLRVFLDIRRGREFQ